MPEVDSNEYSTTTLPPIYSEPTVTEVYEPQPLTREEQLNQVEQTWNEQVKPTAEAMNRLQNPDYAFATADMEIQQELAQAINPVNYAHNKANDAFKTGLKLYALTHPAQAIQLISNIAALHPAAAAALGAGALLFGEPLNNKLRETEWQLQSLSHPGAAIQHKITSTVQQKIMQVTLPVLSKPLVALGYGLGLMDAVKTPHVYDPSVEVLSPVFKPTRWLHEKPANLFEKWAGKAKSKVIKHGLTEYSHLLRARTHRSALQWLLYPLVLAGELGAELLFSFIESKSPQLASLMRGFSGSMARAVFSLNTALPAWAGYNAGSAVAGPLGGTVVGTAAGIGGWYYQSLLNLANNYHSIPAYMLESQTLASSAAARIELMPTSYAKIYGPNYFNNPVAIEQYIRDYGYKIPGTQWRGLAGNADYQMLNGRYLSQEGFLGKVFGKPARLMFQHKILQTLPIRGLALGQILGLPFFSWQNGAVIGGDFILRLLETSPVLNKVKNSALWGAGLGAELAFLTGNGQYWLQYAAVGAATGASIQGLNLLANWEVPAWQTGSWQTGYKYVYGSNLERLTRLENILNTRGETIYNRIRPSYVANFWELANKGEYLTARFPGLAKFGFVNRFFSGFNKVNLRWVSKLRFAQGAWVGEIIGTQLFALTGNPMWLYAGPVAGVAGQVLWDRTIARAAAVTSQKISSFTRFIGQKVVGPVVTGANIVSAMSSWSDYLKTPSWQSIGLTILYSGGAILGLVALGVSWMVATLIVLSTLLIQAIVQLATGFSIIAWLNANVFTPGLNWLGEKIFPFVRGIFNFTGELASAGLGFLMGLFQAATSTSLQTQVAGWATAAFSISTISTGLIAMISASGFFSGISTSARRLASGFLALDVTKQFLSAKTNTNNQVVSASYQINYRYAQPLTDETTGQSASGSTTNLEIIDEFISPRDLNKNDAKVINYTPVTLAPPVAKSDPLQFIFSGLNPGGLKVGQSDSLTLEIEFSQPLPELLKQYNSCSICNRAVFSATIPKSDSDTVQAKTISETVCLNSQGKPAGTPPELAAQNLIYFLQECYDTSCDPQVSTKDFIIPDDYNPEVPYPGCPDPGEIAACEELYMPYYNINNNALDIVRNDVISQTNTDGYLHHLAYIQAGELLLGRNFPIFSNPEDYKQLNQPDGYVYHDGTDGAILGDIIIEKTGFPVNSDGFPYGYIVSTDQGFGISTVLKGNPTPLLPSVASSQIAGYIHYGPDGCF